MKMKLLKMKLYYHTIGGNLYTLFCQTVDLKTSPVSRIRFTTLETGECIFRPTN